MSGVDQHATSMVANRHAKDVTRWETQMDHAGWTPNSLELLIHRQFVYPSIPSQGSPTGCRFKGRYHPPTWTEPKRKESAGSTKHALFFPRVLMTSLFQTG